MAIETCHNDGEYTCTIPTEWEDVCQYRDFLSAGNVTIRTANPSSEVGQNNCTRNDCYKQGTLPYRDAAKDSARLDYERENRGRTCGQHTNLKRKCRLRKQKAGNTDGHHRGGHYADKLKHTASN
jgi:hypothetical protein